MKNQPLFLALQQSRKSPQEQVAGFWTESALKKLEN